MNFSRQKNGYNTEEVDSYILKMATDHENSLKEKQYLLMEYSRKVEIISTSLNQIKNKKDNISSALIAAVDKAKQIEESSKNVYKLKIEELNLLYNKWEGLLGEMIEKYPLLEDTKNIKNMVENFQNSIRKAIVSDINDSDIKISKDNDPIRLLLSKINSYMGRKDQGEEQEKKELYKIERNREVEDRLEDKATLIKPISDIRLNKGERFENLVDKFLSDEDISQNAYSKKFIKDDIKNKESDLIPNESGFDLNEAINPKDDLNEIMKAFDFFEDSLNDLTAPKKPENETEN